MYDDDDDETEDREPVYARNRAMLPGLLQLGKTREFIAYGFMAAALAYAGASRWQTSSQLSACKAEKQAGWVVVLDAHGEKVDLPAQAAADWRPNEGMIVDKLARTVKCLRGLDPVPSVISACWKEAPPLFYGAASVNAFNAFRAERAPNLDAVARHLAQETILVTVDGYTRPEPEQAPNRFWLHWTETHQPRNGPAKTETWSGTFDVELVPFNPKEGNSGLHIVRWDWRQALVAAKGAG